MPSGPDVTGAHVGVLGRYTVSKRELRFAVARHRRLLSAGLLAGSVALTITALAPPPPPTVSVLAAATDLDSGTSLRPHHVRLVELPPAAVPAGALRHRAEVTGRVLTAAVRRGETLTDVRIVGQALLGSYGAGTVAVPVRIADADAVALLHPGDVVDVLAAAAPDVETGAEAAPAARLVASSVPVLSRPRLAGESFGGGFDEGALVVVAATEQTAARLAAAAVTSRLSVTIRQPGQ